MCSFASQFIKIILGLVKIKYKIQNRFKNLGPTIYNEIK
jgi:hypothetical protein